MVLNELAQAVGNAKIVCGGETMQQSENTQITGLCVNSDFVKEGDLFFCLTGGKTDSHLFIPDAIEKGAAAIVCERETEISVPQIVVPDSRLAMSLIAGKFYGEPSKRLKIVGITGTNGKTTTAYMLASVLKRAGKSVGIVGTLGVFYGRKKIAPELTTPDPVFLHGIFADMVKCGVEYVVMEVSAHALYYKKDAGISYAACVFTNFTQDHLDFFGTMKNYKAVKKSLFVQEKCPIAVLNGDDELGREIGKACEESGIPTVWYALDTPADTFAVVTFDGATGSESMFNLSDSLCRISLSMPGVYNVYNAMAAATCARALGVGVTEIAAGLKALRGVNGRLERVTSCRNAEVFVDYAHTPDGLEKSLSALRGYCKGKLYCLFGCGGNRDRAKRPLMGEIAAKHADFSVLTSDNPRFEDPVDILAEIEAGYRRFSEKYVTISDRKDAIFYALGLLGRGDILLVAGKGGEDTQEIMGIKYAYNDKTVIREAIKRLSLG